VADVFTISVGKACVFLYILTAIIGKVAELIKDYFEY